MTRTRLPIRARSIHEAAHVVAARLDGLVVESASIAESLQTLGGVKTARNLLAEVADGDTTETKVELAIAELAIAEAGPAAQRQLVRVGQLEADHEATGCESDWMRRVQLRSALGPVLDDENTAKRYFQEAQRRAGHVTNDAWAHVVRIAEKLERHHQLDRSAIEAELSALAPLWSVPFRKGDA